MGKGQGRLWARFYIFVSLSLESSIGWLTVHEDLFSNRCHGGGLHENVRGGRPPSNVQFAPI